jgi:hypothetical protein
MLRQNRTEHLADAKLLGAVSPELGFDDASFHDLNADTAVLDILGRNDCPAQMKATRAIDIADRARDGGEVCLRDLLAEIGLIGFRKTVLRDSMRTADRNAPQDKFRPGVAVDVGSPDRR